MAQRYLALLRGINVGGKNRLPMASFRELLGELGAGELQTYIQSGNAVFTYPQSPRAALAKSLSSAIQRVHGFAPQVWVIPISEFDQAIRENPFPEAVEEPKTLHLFCLAEPVARWDVDAARKFQKPSERVVLRGAFLYLHAPEGLGTSKLTERMDRLLGVATTARNWRTVLKLQDLARVGEEC